ncbi:MAG: FCD domain-containing protein [Streptosporangiales bacterium]|nr:FCD domain-containing protein [Streptosporangiales bacterium]
MSGVSRAVGEGVDPPRTARQGEPTAGALSAYFVPPEARGRTTEAVTEALREAILDGVLAPSTWLREDMLAEIFEVSRTPVREALRRLADEGLMIKTAHHGTVVAGLSLEDILALYIVRENLEGLAARLAAARRPGSLITKLESVQSAMRRNAERGDDQRLVQQNLEFHRIIREAAGNPYLDRFLTQVEQAVRRLPGSTLTQPGRPEGMLLEHEAILDAIRTGNGEEAERSAKAHMRRAREIRLSALLGH